MDPEKNDSDRSGSDPEKSDGDGRRSSDIANIEQRIGAIVKAQKTGHSNRRKSSDLRRSVDYRSSMDARRSTDHRTSSDPRVSTDHRRSSDHRRSTDQRIPSDHLQRPADHRRITEQPEEEMAEKGFVEAAAPQRPVAQTRPSYKESIEVPDYRFSMASDNSSDPERPGIAGTLSSSDGGRPALSRPQSTRTQATTRTLPELMRYETKLAQKEAHPWQHLGLTLGGPMIALFDITIPCIIFYTWYNSHRSNYVAECAREYPALSTADCPIPFKDYDKDILGYAIICFGFGELWILIARVHRLLFHGDDCAPLLNRHRWELDATSWVYGVAMILALIPFVVGSSLELIHLYLYSPSFIMGFLGLLMFVTTFFPFTLPIGINSQAKGTELRPFIYYAAEDFIAVDGLQDREFRVRYNERYETNRMFRKFFVNLTLWWMLGVCTYIGAVSAVIWCTPFHIAFGLSFGVLFAYIAIWASVTFVWVKYEMAREHRAYEEGAIEA